MRMTTPGVGLLVTGVQDGGRPRRSLRGGTTVLCLRARPSASDSRHSGVR
jgi:hypothetical protein